MVLVAATLITCDLNDHGIPTDRVSMKEVIGSIGHGTSSREMQQRLAGHSLLHVHVHA